MDPMLLALFAGWWLHHALEEASYKLRGQTSPRMKRKLEQAAAARAKAQRRARRGQPARDFFAAIWADAWTDAHQARQRARARRAAARQAAANQGRHGRPGPTPATAQRLDQDDNDDVIDAEVVDEKAQPEPERPVAEHVVNAYGCDGRCTNSSLDPSEAEARGLCPMCAGRRELIIDFGGVHRHVRCGYCGGTGRSTAANDQAARPPHRTPEPANPASDNTPKESAMSTAVNAEATSVTAAVEFAQQMHTATGDGVASVEVFAANLRDGQVTGRPLQLASTATELLGQLHTVFSELSTELQRHLVVADAYTATNNEAGGKQFSTTG